MTPEEELERIAATVRAYLAWEDELSGTGLSAPDPVPAPVPEPVPNLLLPSAPVPDHAATPKLTPDERRAILTVLAEQAATCTACVLHRERTQSVFSRGNPDSPLVFVGEGPGYHEDQKGLPFVGPAGELLDKMIAAMGYARDDVYICNVVKCRPPQNRTPLPDEAAACAQFLVPQIEAIAPAVIVALGRCAAEALGCAERAGAGPTRPWRGVWGAWRGIPVMPTYHPAFLLRSPHQKKPVWEDLQKVMAKLGKPPRQRA